MKKLFWLSSCVACWLMASTGATAADDAVLRALKGEVSGELRAVEVINGSGKVNVVAATSGFGWEWTLRSSDHVTSKVEAYAQECRLEVREREGVLQLEVIRPERDRREGSNGLRKFLSVVTLGTVSAREPGVLSDVTVRVPAASAVNVKHRFGDVRVSGTKGSVAVDSGHGRVEVVDVAGAVTARTTFGSLRAERIGPAELTAQNGGIDVRDVAGDLRATTSFARMKVHGVRGSAVLQNQNGAIEAVRISGNLIAGTSFGELRVEEVGGMADLTGRNTTLTAGGITKGLKARTSFGALRVRDVGRNAALNNQNGAIEAVRVTGDLAAETSFAHVRVEEIGGRATLVARNGKIDATRVSGDVRASTSFAGIHVQEIGGGAELKGQNGDVTASGVTGDILAETSFARLRLDGSGKRFAARNQNGSVEVVARSSAVEVIDASASFGSIDVRLPDDVTPLVRASAAHGKVTSDFPVRLGDTMSDGRFAADATPLKVTLKGQHGDIRVHHLATR